jgi:hypothetical protein
MAQLTDIKNKEAGEPVSEKSKAIFMDGHIKYPVKNELERCIDDYKHVPGYLASTANHEKGLLLEIYRHDKNKQLILSPDGNFFEIHFEHYDPTKIFDVESIDIDEVIDDYGGYEAVAHEIDRAIGAHNMAVAKRHKEVCPEKYDEYGLLKY